MRTGSCAIRQKRAGCVGNAVGVPGDILLSPVEAVFHHIARHIVKSPVVGTAVAGALKFIAGNLDDGLPDAVRQIQNRHGRTVAPEIFSATGACGAFPLRFARQFELYAGTSVEPAEMGGVGRISGIEVLGSTHIVIGAEAAERKCIRLILGRTVGKPCVLADSHLKNAHPVV